MSRVVLIGYGNPLRRDDGFGWWLARRLQNEWCDPDIEIIAAHQLTPELAEPLGHADYAIFADACATAQDELPDLQEIVADETPESQFSHQMNPGSLLALARALYGAAPSQSWLLTVGAQDMGYGEQLSAPVACALDTAVMRARALCIQLSQTQARAAIPSSP